MPRVISSARLPRAGAVIAALLMGEGLWRNAATDSDQKAGRRFRNGFHVGLPALLGGGGGQLVRALGT